MPTGVYLRTKEQLAKFAGINKGRIHSAETRARMGASHKVGMLSVDTRAKLSRAKMGILNPMYGKTLSLEHRAKKSKALMGNKNALGHHHTKEWKNRMSIIQKGVKHKSPTMATRIKLSECNIGKILSEKTKRKIGIASRQHWQDDEIRARIIKGIKKCWMNPAYRDNWLRKTLIALNIKPNKPEKILLSLLNTVAPNEWAFVGDGQLIVGGKNPDFWNGDSKLIELFGDYWHGERARCYEETEEGRIKLFRQYGYMTLVIWENELKTPSLVLSKLQKYIRV